MLKIGQQVQVKNWLLKRRTERSVDVESRVGPESDSGIYRHDGHFSWDRPENVPEYVKKAAYRAVGSGTADDPNRSGNHAASEAVTSSADFDEDTIRAEMAVALDVDPDDLKIEYSPLSSFGVGEAYEVSLGSGGSKSWIVVADDDVAEAIALTSVTQDLENEPEIFNQSFIESHINVDRLRRDLSSDVQNQRYEDLKDEAERKPEAFIKDHDLEWPSPTDKQLREHANDQSDDADEVAKAYAALVEMDAEDQWSEIGEEPEVDDADIERISEEEAEDQLKDPVAYLQDIYGKDDGIKQAIEIGGIDVAAAARDAVDTDGWQHFLSRYDGNSEETKPSRFVFWREN